MSRSIRWHALAATLTLAGCATAAPEGPALEIGVAPLTPPQAGWCARQRAAGAPTPWWCGGREGALAPPFDAACSDAEWLGLPLEGGACLPVTSRHGTWTLDAPFARSADPRLQGLCRYRWQPADPARPAPDLDALPDAPSLRLERDCEVVAGHGLPEAATDALYSAWRDQVEAPDWSGGAPPAAQPVRVAVIDGGFGGVVTPFGPGEGGLAHPVAVSSAVRALACPTGAAGCLTGTPNYNAMRYVRQGIPGEIGGYFGTQGGFAEAVTAAVDDWRLAPAAERPARLILNLSLGWDGTFDVSQSERIAGAAALWALEYASCEGALLIAAAGNQATVDDTGPLFPAAYEQRPRTCGPPAPPGTYAPLVHAVGGVDGRDRLLGLARPGGTPRLVAPAAFVVTPEDTVLGIERPTAVLSGTSMAAAAGSGAAALLWSLRPELTGDEIMAALYQGGEALGVAAEFGLGALQPQRRLSVARAFALACPEGVAVGGCPAAAERPSLPAPRPAGEDARLPFGDLVALLYAQVVDAFEAIDPPPPVPGDSAYFSPWSVPQPGTPNCPVCGIWQSQLYGSLDPGLAGTWVGNPVLRYKNGSGDLIDISLQPLPEKDYFKVDLSGSLAGKTVISAWLVIPASIGGETVYTSSQLDVD